jgi:pimeloyl-ACP methyl ester carboxylesterase
MTLQVEGAEVFVARGGRAGGPDEPAIVLIHGAGMDHSVWSLQTRALAHRGRRAFALDLPGHGRSGGAPRDSIESYAAWIIAFLDATRIASACLFGHSMGALIALATAAMAPQRVSRIALLGAAPEMRVHSDLLTATARGEARARELVTAWGFGRRAHLGGAQAPGIWMLGSGLRLLERDDRLALAADLTACNAYHAARDAASTLAMPVLLIAGALDRMASPRGARELAGLIKQSKLEIFENSGHLMMIEEPDRTLDVLASFA